MSSLYNMSRILTGILGFIALGGVVWFGSILNNMIALAAVLLGLASLATVFVPQRKLSSGVIRQILIALCIVGIGAGFFLVVDNLRAPGGIEWDVVSMNVLHIIALATMALIALRRSLESAQQA